MKHKILWILIVLLLGAYFFAKANPEYPTVIKVRTFISIRWEQIMTRFHDASTKTPRDFLLEEETGIIACTMEYAPVCAEVEVNCLTPPCAKIKRTFSNKCLQQANKRSTFLYDGACQ